jgi:hypothetical protein
MYENYGYTIYSDAAVGQQLTSSFEIDIHHQPPPPQYFLPKRRLNFHHFSNP